MLPPSSEVTVSGFGLSRFGDRATAGKLRFAHLRVAGIANIGVPSLALTADGTPDGRGRSACLGDSGGPIVVENYFQSVLVGLVSLADAERGKVPCAGVTFATPVALPEDVSRAHASELRRRRLRLSGPARLGTRHWRGWRQLAVKLRLDGGRRRCPTIAFAATRPAPVANCALARSANSPPCATSSSKVPISTTRPCSKTRMRSALRIVASDAR